MPRRAIDRQYSNEDRAAWRALQAMPNVGPVTAAGLLRLGIRSREELVGRDPDELYEELVALDSQYHDPCVRDVFAAIVTFAENGAAEPWWAFTPARKERDLDASA